MKWVSLEKYNIDLAYSDVADKDKPVGDVIDGLYEAGQEYSNEYAREQMSICMS